MAGVKNDLPKLPGLKDVFVRKGSLQIWMRANYARLERQFEGKPNWAALAEALAGTGLQDNRGNPPNRNTLYQMYRRLKSAKAALPLKSIVTPPAPEQKLSLADERLERLQRNIRSGKP